MPFTQKDIVKVKFELPDGKILTHPVLILSCEKACSHESNRRYTGVMITHATVKDRYTFELKKEMIDGPWQDVWSQIRLHIIISFKDSDISRDASHFLGKIKKVYIKEIIDQITSYVFSID